MKSRLIQTLVAVAGLAAAPAVLAQNYPTKPIRIIVVSTPGGSVDTMARAVGPKLAARWGQQVLVDNRPGAPKLPFDPVKDFTPLTMVSTSPSILVAHPKVPANNVQELIALARAKPGQLNFAIGALGSSLHLAGDAFKMKSGTFIVNIPYRGTAPAVQDLLAGQVDLMFAAVGNVQQHIRAGKLKALGVTSPQRLSAFPEVPSIGEALPGYESAAWFGLFGPGRMPPELTKRLSDAARAAVQSPEVRRRIEHEGATPVGNSPEQFARFVDSEISRWGAVVRYSGAKPE